MLLIAMVITATTATRRRTTPTPASTAPRTHPRKGMLPVDMDGRV